MIIIYLYSLNYKLDRLQLYRIQKIYDVSLENTWIEIPYPKDFNYVIIQNWYYTDSSLYGTIALKVDFTCFSFRRSDTGTGTIGIDFLFFKL